MYSNCTVHVGVGGRYAPPRDMFGTVPGLTLPRSTSGDTASQYGARRAPWIPPPPRALAAFPTRSQPGPCLSLRMSVRALRSDWGRRGHPFREKVPFSLNSTHFHENGGISPFWGFFAKSATLRAKAPFGAPSREVALNLRNIDGSGSHFPPKALLGPKSSHFTKNHQFSRKGVIFTKMEPFS